MVKEKDIIKVLKSPSSTRDIKYMALELIASEFDPTKLIELAKQKGVINSLGYLSEVSAIAAEQSHLPYAKKLYSLANALYGKNGRTWSYLSPNIPDFAKRIALSSPQGELNKKWKIYSTLMPEHIKDWIGLYKIGK